jgi:hypothetical protein
MRMSDARASSVPPPKAMPLTAAITGLLSFSISVKEVANGEDEFLHLNGRQGGPLFQIRAGAKGPVPAPVMMTTRTSGSKRTMSILALQRAAGRN